MTARTKADLMTILGELGNQPGFSTCDCAYCFATREIERRITMRQALHTQLGAGAAESIGRDMGAHWALFAAIATGKEGPAMEACVAVSRSDAVDLVWSPIP